MAKMIYLCDFHLDNLIHIYAATKSCAVMKDLCSLLMFLRIILCFFLTPNLASTVFTTNLHQNIKKIECSKNFLTYVDK